MTKFRFFRDFDWDGPGPCVLCKFVTWAFKRTEDDPVDVPDEAAAAAEAAGAGERVE